MSRGPQDWQTKERCVCVCVRARACVCVRACGNIHGKCSNLEWNVKSLLAKVGELLKKSAWEACSAFRRFLSCRDKCCKLPYFLECLPRIQ